MQKSSSFFSTGLILVGMLAAAQGLAVLFPREPEYHGKALHVWLEQLCGASGAPQASAVEAFQHMGPEALTPLVRMIGAHDSTLKKDLAEAIQRHCGIDFHLVPAQVQRDQARRGFCALGSTASPAIPALTGLLDDPETRMDAAGALACIGREAVGPLIGALAVDDTEDRTRIVWLLGTLHGDASAAIPALVKLLRDEDEGVRTASVTVLGGIGRKPAMVVPALIQALADPGALVRRTIAFELRVFGRDEPEVVPALIKLLEDEDGGVRQSAADSLGRIGNGTAAVVSALREHVADPAPWARRSAVEALARLGIQTVTASGEIQTPGVVAKVQ